MEREAFDRFARLIGSAGTRRDAVRLVATAALLGGAATLQGAAAKSHKKRGKVRAQQTSEVCPGPATLRDCSKVKLGPGANLSNCDLIDRDFINFNVRAANLSGTSFFLSSFGGPQSPNFRGVNASNVCFGQASLDFADFRGANLRGADFCGADVRGANFLGSNITAEQLACVAGIGCDTILPNGKPAVPCTGGQICCGAVCCNPENCEQNTCVEPPEA